MSRTPTWPPPVRRHKTGQARVRIHGRDYYLGKYGSPEAQLAYARLLATGTPAPPAVQPGTTVRELAVPYLAALAERYRRVPSRGHTNEHRETQRALEPLLALFGRLPAHEFGRAQFRAVRDKLGGTPYWVNKQAARIRRLFRWAEEQDLVKEPIGQRLAAVRPLPQPRGRPRPVPLEHLEPVLRQLTPLTATMVRLQLYTGMRPGELVLLRPRDLDRTGEFWRFQPQYHKNQWRGQERNIWLGPRAQALLVPLLAIPAGQYVFRPRDVRVDMGERYTTRSYGQAVRRACRRAGVPLWSVHQLRHTAATLFRQASGGLEAPQLLLGHESRSTTEIYAEMSTELLDVLRKVG